MILCDTGVLVAAALVDQPHNRICGELLAGLRAAGHRLAVPATVAAEVGYLLDREYGPEAEAMFLEAMSNGQFLPVDLVTADYDRMTQLVRRYSDFPLGTTDASLLALAERFRVTTIATLDRRHFAAVRLSHGGALTLLPETLAH
jgi:predicted nucleic acid-binding protein